ncbi:Anr2p [Sugiyamaella lignohabitans]|uniref:Anr2p n=1 Tax=Sugiyamaella lignohabitans TaxID=796027 RepID=A0A167ETW2_9ASCO|nr:Anr2p [Sugiyamaella lignohabitans]ANB14446.1 Anr2p [Sugiyamaella lignohabitans]
MSGHPRKKLAIGAFLIKFDMRTGNSLIWSKSQPGIEIDWEGVEFMAMPSGLHSRQSDVIRFVLSNPLERVTRTGSTRDRLLGDEAFGYLKNNIEGIAVFNQNFHRGDATTTRINVRSTIQMYSLGVLCTKSDSEISSKCWGFVDILTELLTTFMNLNQDNHQVHETLDFRPFESLLQYDDNGELQTLSLSPPRLSAKPLNLAPHHPILSTTELLVTYGPLIFEIWKAALLRDKILLMDKSNSISVDDMCKFVYIISVFGTVPNDVFDLIPRNKQHSLSTATNPIYNVNVSDITSLSHLKHFIATTTDEILLEKEYLYNMTVVKTGDRAIAATTSTTDFYGNLNTMPISAGFHDKRRFQILISGLGIETPHHTSGQSILAHVCSNISSLFSLTSLYGLLWWATAGEQANSDTDRYLEGLPLLTQTQVESSSHVAGQRASSYATESPYFNAISELSPPQPSATMEPWQISVIGYFQAKTRRIFETVASIVESQDQDQSETSLQTVISIEPPDLMDMGLDPISLRDHEFVVKFISLWWGRPARVNHVCC